MSLSTFLPVAPFWGHAFVGGSVNGPGYIQLYNPNSSGVTVVVYSVSLAVPNAIVNITREPSVRMRRATPGLTSTNTLTPGVGFLYGDYTIFRPDPSFTSASSASFYAVTFSLNGVTFQDNEAQWWGHPVGEGQNGWQPTIVRPSLNGFPVIVSPGSAWEIQANAGGIGNKIHASILWTEERT